MCNPKYMQSKIDWETVYKDFRTFAVEILYQINDEKITSVEQMWKVWDAGRGNFPQ